jgi:hypothetical protein
MVNELAKLSREVERNRAETRDTISACFRYAVRQLGEAEARRYWAEVAKRKGGKPKGTTNPTIDAAILTHYDDWVRHHPDKQSLRNAASLVGSYLADIFPGKYGPSADAITKRLRRLLRLRKPEPPGTRNALAVLSRIGKLPVGDPPWDTDK